MAQAFGRCTGRPGVVMTTSGPGLINAVCGVATAQADRDPLVAITGQVPRGMRFKSYHQYLDTVGLFAPITKWSVGIDEPGTIPEVLANAFRIAARPRRVPSTSACRPTSPAHLPLESPCPPGCPLRPACPRMSTSSAPPCSCVPLGFRCSSSAWRPARLLPQRRSVGSCTRPRCRSRAHSRVTAWSLASFLIALPAASATPTTSPQTGCSKRLTSSPVSATT